MVVLHTSLNVLWAIWEIPALPLRKEMFYVVGSLEGAHGARLAHKTTLPWWLQAASKVSMGKIKQGATAMCVYSSPASSMVTGFIEKGLSARSYQTEVNPAMFSLNDRVGKKLTGCVLHVSIGRKLAVIRDAEKLKNSESTVGSLPEGFKELICFGCVDCLIYNI